MNKTFDNWYAIDFEKNIKPNKIYPINILGERLILFRDQYNNVSCLEDRCPHRSTPLSLGRMNNGKVECKYHGWQFDAMGKCTHIPALDPNKPIPPKACASHKTTMEKHGLIWVHSQKPEILNIPDSFNDLFSPRENSYRFNYGVDLSLPHELMIENLLDPAHLPFTHHGTISKRDKAVPIDFMVNEDDEKITGTATINEKKQQKRIEFIFIKPYIVCFDAVFSGNKGMRQIHFCIPTGEDTMRLNSVFYYKNMPWLGKIPFMNYIQTRMSNKIVGQDIEMLQGQNDNIKLGAKPWNQAINADKMAKRYRNWLEMSIKKR
jgi:chlorophyllide a oxygenase